MTPVNVLPESAAIRFNSAKRWSCMCIVVRIHKNIYSKHIYVNLLNNSSLLSTTPLKIETFFGIILRGVWYSGIDDAKMRFVMAA